MAESPISASGHVTETITLSRYVRPCRLKPKPMVARSREDIIAARGVKPCISPNLSVLATVEALQARLYLSYSRIALRGTLLYQAMLPKTL